MWDVAGTLAGNWFREGVPRSAEAMSPDYWNDVLAFAGDPRVGDAQRIGLGDPELGCICAPLSSDPSFEEVTVASGTVVFRLRDVDAAGVPLPSVVTTLLVQLLAADRLRVEVFEGNVANPSFTDAATIYRR